MTSNPRAWVLDVGHGNSTVIEESGSVSIVDGGKDSTLIEFLSEKGFQRIDTVILSHADSDHFIGISLLLSDPNFYVEHVYLNSDDRDAQSWSDFSSVMRDAKARGTKFSLELSNVNPGEITFDAVRLEVLGPSQEFAYTTPGGRSPDGSRKTANSMSAVVRVWADEEPRILLTGDIDQVGLDSLTEDHADISADVLVFPHHGGLPGKADPAAFAGTLAKAVGPRLVIFSIGRGGYRNPRPEIVSTVLGSSDGAHIACTQLSTRCSETLPTSTSALHAGVAQGAASGACCAGTIEISLRHSSDYTPGRISHLEFISRNAPTALCRRPST